VGNAHHVKTKILVEAANIPMKPEIEHELTKKGVLVVPDFVANAGGVISSYVESIGGTKEEMFSMVKEKITANTRLVLERAKNGDLRAAALEIAEERVIAAMEKNSP
ncbi:MAG: Glu/Leu/Phe/Val dehydrogenase, partial [Candidatus Micrarchaeota archaeon]|nr:Glu/Leu/Phe/Val dehydrogenase [Candidatus Micrarchaeota archaeon]